MSEFCKAKVSLPQPEVRVGGDRLGWAQMGKLNLQRVEILTEEVLVGSGSTQSA
ncbi:hypothetical protein HDF16_005990 [Granulicella aggregans]|uniref:Uncharacterized protein n=1 Tax=Granulicella aggregans TaxID=474949 RepID=A0A7W7ZJT8_9BACT|nr:hypothetical protein [Granulicella aggregans]